MIIDRVKQRYRVCISHQSSAVERRNVCDYAQAETALSPSKESAINQGYLLDYPQGETALSRVSQ